LAHALLASRIISRCAIGAFAAAKGGGGTLGQQNMVVDGGHVDVLSERLRIGVSGAFASPKDIENLVIRGRGLPGTPASSELFTIRDIATVTRGYVDPPECLTRYNGEPAIGIALAPLPGINAVDMGKAVDKRLREVMAQFPIGIEVRKISQRFGFSSHVEFANRATQYSTRDKDARK